MPLLEQTDHEIIIDTYFRYARLNAINSEEDTADITILDAGGAPTSEAYTSVPIFYHCEPDMDQRANGALVGASNAFRDYDTVIVRFEEGNPKIVGIKDVLRPCRMPHGVFIEDTTIRLYRMTGDPYDGDLHFKSPVFWGAAQHVWFLGKAYWVLSGGGVKYNVSNGWYQPRDQAAEVSCTGLPEDINEFQVTKPGQTYHMRATREDGNAIYGYQSPDGIAWNYTSSISFALGITTIAGEPTPLIPSPGWVRFDYDRFFVEHKTRDEHEEGYPDEFFRLYRIGIQERWDEYGLLNTEERAWTMIAGSGSIFSYHFANENDFTVEGEFSGLQLLQIFEVSDAD